MKNFSLLFGILILLSACGETEEKVVFQPLDLLNYGIPVTIMAPDSADVKKSEFGSVKDITVRKEKDFFVQIYARQTTTTDVAKRKAEELAEVKNKKYFSKIVKEDPAGFIYETKVDSNYIDYGFRYLQIQGSNEYLFQTGLIGPFTLEAVEDMYQAVQQQ